MEPSLKPYRVSSSIFDEAKFAVEMAHCSVVDSTQSYLKRRLSQTGIPPTSSEGLPVWCVSSEDQTRGVGKGVRKWVHVKGHQSLAFSMCFPISPDVVRRSPLLTQILALSAASAIELLFPAKSITLKWPNDLIFEGRKVGGILAELESLPGDQFVVVIGIGINVRGDNLSIENSTTSSKWPPGYVSTLTDPSIDTLEVRDEILSQFLNRLNMFLVNDPTATQMMLTEISAKQHLFGSRVVFSTSDGCTVVGTHTGLSADGGLILDDGKSKQIFNSGELVME